MAKNYIQEGSTLTLTAPSGGVTSGEGYVIEGLFVVALGTASAGDEFEGMTAGVFELTKNAAAENKDFDAGEQVFWDNTEKRIDKTNAAFYPIGVATKDAASTATSIHVRLDGITTAVVGA